MEHGVKLETLSWPAAERCIARDPVLVLPLGAAAKRAPPAAQQRCNHRRGSAAVLPAGYRYLRGGQLKAALSALGRAVFKPAVRPHDAPIAASGAREIEHGT
jgi:hypothetical protein